MTGAAPAVVFFAGDALPNPFSLSGIWFYRLNGKLEGPFALQSEALTELLNALNRLYLWQHLKVELKEKSARP